MIRSSASASYLRGPSRDHGPARLIEIELGLVILSQLGILILFAQEAVAYRQYFHIGAHEAAKCASGRLDNRRADPRNNSLFKQRVIYI